MELAGSSGTISFHGGASKNVSGELVTIACTCHCWLRGPQTT